MQQFYQRLTFQVYRMQAAPKNQKINICLPAVFPQAKETLNSVETTPESASPIEGIQNVIDEDDNDIIHSANIMPR